MAMELDCTGTKYTLRAKSLLKRIESERSRHKKRREPREKQKPAPLSKYRRKTANARERNRMREINEAFETLQKTLPNLPGTDADKLTKITVLRLAVNYIKILSCVVDGDVFVPKDIEQLKELWCMKNAHMAQPEHCVKSVMKPTAETSEIKSPITLKPKPRIKSPFKLCEGFKDRTPSKKRSSKPTKGKGKVCKTASIATSNGAYITLKNVALQTSGKRPYLDNEPLMMSMTVKRPRMEPIAYQRPPKITKFQPHTQSTSKTYKNNVYKRKTIKTEETSCFPTISKLPLNNTPNFNYYDLDSPTFLKNDIFLESPFSSNKFVCDSNISKLSPPSNPSSPMLPSFPTETPKTTSDSSPSFCSSDNDSALTTDLDSLLGSDSFENEFESLASFFNADSSLGFLLDHATSGFLG